VSHVRLCVFVLVTNYVNISADHINRVMSWNAVCRNTEWHILFRLLIGIEAECCLTIYLHSMAKDDHGHEPFDYVLWSYFSNRVSEQSTHNLWLKIVSHKLCSAAAVFEVYAAEFFPLQRFCGFANSTLNVLVYVFPPQVWTGIRKSRVLTFVINR
jgi:hypothetical protein